MRILLNPFWTAVSYFKKTRGSLAKRAIERVSANVARWIRDGRLGLDTGEEGSLAADGEARYVGHHGRR